MALFTLSAFFWLIIDLLSKAWAASSAFVPFQLIDHWLYFTFTRNQGVAFGISLPFWARSIGSSVIILLLTICFLKSDLKFRKMNQILGGIILGGALGNLLDRIISGAVTDFIALAFFPVFNAADIGITLGLIIMVIYNFNK